jgi:hypothetical protein
VLLSWESPVVALFDMDRNVEVPATVEPFAGLARVWLFRPNQVLSPNTTYGFGYGGPRGIGSFRTGTTTDHEPPGYMELTSFVAETAGPFSDSCGGLCRPRFGQRMKFDYSPPPADTSLLLLEVRGADTTTLSTVPIPLYAPYVEWPRLHTTGMCSFVGAAFGADEEICARIVALDMAGLRGEASPEICTRVSACPPPAPNSCSWSCDLPGDAGSGDAGAGDSGATDVPPPPFDTDPGGCSMSPKGSRPASPAALLAVFAAIAALVRRLARSNGASDPRCSVRGRSPPLRRRRPRSIALQCRDGIEARGLPCRVESEEDAHGHRKTQREEHRIAGDSDVVSIPTPFAERSIGAVPD